VTTAAGATIGYDALLVAPGANAIEALRGALTFSGGTERHRFAELLAAMGKRAARRVAFVVPRQVTWPIAAYELALLTAAERDARRLPGVEIVLVTRGSAPLEVFCEPRAWPSGLSIAASTWPIDPSVASASAAISDPQRRIGWLRELEGRAEGEMSAHLSRFDRGISQLIALSRRAGILKGPSDHGG
jgi:hypothetical protein